MRVMNFLINKTGAFINPTGISTLDPKAMVNNPDSAQITLSYYNNITTNANGEVIPIDPVTTGMTGTITIQLRPNKDCGWSDIDGGGVLNLANGDNIIFTAGVISQINVIPVDVTGCNYINIQLDRGS
jgi:hypothetical protein